MTSTKACGCVVEESSKNHRDFFSVIFVPHGDLEHHPQSGVEGLRGKVSRPKFKPLFLILLQFVCLLESWPKNLLLTDFPWSAVLKCSHSLLSFFTE